MITMTKYRKKPVVVDVELYQPGMEDGFDCYSLNGQYIGYFDKLEPKPRANCYPVIKTLEGNHRISPGDYIITGVRGEKYAIKPDIFTMTYEAVQDGDNNDCKYELNKRCTHADTGDSCSGNCCCYCKYLHQMTCSFYCRIAADLVHGIEDGDNND